MPKIIVPLPSLIESLTRRRFSLLLALFVLTYVASALGFSFLYRGPLHNQLKPTFLASSDTDWWDSLHFSFTTQATVGYGDYRPIGIARLVAAAQALWGITLNAIFLGVVINQFYRPRGRLAIVPRCCFDPASARYYFRILNRHSQQIINAFVVVDALRELSEEDDPVIRHKFQLWKLHLLPQPTFIDAGLLYGVCTIPVRTAWEASVTSENEIEPIPPDELMETDVVRMRVNGELEHAGAPIVARKAFRLSEISCGRFAPVVSTPFAFGSWWAYSRPLLPQLMMRDLGRFEETQENHCQACRFHSGCRLSLAIRVRELPELEVPR